MRLVGWVAIAGLLAPLVFAAWVSFSPDSFLTPPAGEWSTRWYVAFASDRRWVAALGRSLLVGAFAAVVALAAGAMLPACVPPAVLGMGLLPLLFAAGLWGNPLGLVLAHGLLGLPVVFLLARNHLDQTPPDLEAAARGLGAGPWQVAFRVTLPLLRPAILAGAAAAFVISLNEAMLTAFLATPSTETLPAVVWPQLRYSASPLVAVASGASTLAAIVGVWATIRVVRRWG